MKVHPPNQRVHDASRSRVYQAMYPEKRAYTVYRYNARKKGRDFTLSYPEFLTLIQTSCHYCGALADPHLNGLDRVDNGKGYSADNVVSCCTSCNLAKRDLNEAQYISNCLSVVKYQALKEGLLEYKHIEYCSGEDRVPELPSPDVPVARE